jgi:hypothetical protein
MLSLTASMLIRTAVRSPAVSDHEMSKSQIMLGEANERQNPMVGYPVKAGDIFSSPAITGTVRVKLSPV